MWFSTLAEEVVMAIGRLRVYVACLTRWDPVGDEAVMERKKFRDFRVGAETGTKRMTEHMLYDMCSGSRLFYEVEVESERVEGFVDVIGNEEQDDEERWEGMECEFCVATLQTWVDYVEEDEDGKKRVTREKLVELVW